MDEDDQLGTFDGFTGPADLVLNNPKVKALSLYEKTVDVAAQKKLVSDQKTEKTAKSDQGHMEELSKITLSERLGEAIVHTVDKALSDRKFNRNTNKNNPK